MEAARALADLVEISPQIEAAAVVAREGELVGSVGVPDGRALRRLCRLRGPWRTAALGPGEAAGVAAACALADVACVVDGGRRHGPGPSVIDATGGGLRVAYEGALPATFIEGTMLMGTRRQRLAGLWAGRRRS